jgi:hypothetical protein
VITQLPRSRTARLRLVGLAIAVALVTLANPVEASRGQGPPPPGWTVTPASNTSVPNGQLQGVSCVERSCMAVGSFFDELGGRAPMAESATADGWSVHPVPLPDDAVEGHLSAVSCASPGTCVAVGYMVVGQEERPLAERWDGQRWSLMPALGLTGRLFGVSCPASDLCFAVGAAADTALAARWDGMGPVRSFV